MKITLSQYAGFCDGVKRAYDMIVELAGNPETKQPIVVLGSLVHNEDVVKKIESLGVEKGDGKNWKEYLTKEGSKIGTVVITAHGMGPEIYQFAKDRDINLVDTTCPRVIKAQRLAESFHKKGYQIVIVGEREHKETKGINQWAESEGVFVETKDEVFNLKLDQARKILIISQTTQNYDFVNWAVDEIKSKYPKAEALETVCFATQERQGEMKQLAKDNDVVIVIGSSSSANSKQLFEIAKKINPKSYFIDNALMLDKTWFAGAETVGISAGASTPDWIIEEIIEKLSSF